MSVYEQASNDLRDVRGKIYKLGKTFQDFQSHSFSILALSDQWRNLNNSFEAVNKTLEVRVNEVEAKEREVDMIKNKFQNFYAEVELKQKKLELMQRSWLRKIAMADIKEKKVKVLCDAIEMREFGVMKRVEAVELKEKGLDVKEKQLDQHCKQIGLKEKELDDLSNVLKSKEKELDEHCRQIESKEQGLNDLILRIVLKSKENGLDEQCKQIELKEKELDGLSNVLKSKEEELDELYSLVEGKENNINEQRKGLECREKQIEEQCKEIEAKEKELDDLSNVLKSKEKKLDELYNLVEGKENDMNEQRKRLECREKQVEEQCKQIEAKEKELDDLSKVLKSKEKEVNDQQFASSKVESAVDGPSSSNNGVDILSFFKSMDADGLRSYLIEHVNEQNMLQEKILDALRSAPDPAKLVFDVCLSFLQNFRQRDLALANKSTCIFLMEQLMKLSPRFTQDMKDEAKCFAGYLITRLEARQKGNNNTPADYYGVLQFIATFKVACFRNQSDRLLSLLKKMYCTEKHEVYRHKQQLSLCHELGLLEKILDLLNNLVERKKWMAAIKFICVLKLEYEFSPVSLLECRLEYLYRRVKEKKLQGELASAEQMESDNLRDAVKYMTFYNLNSKSFPLESLISRIKELENQAKEEKKLPDNFAKLRKRNAASSCSSAESLEQLKKRPRVGNAHPRHTMRLRNHNSTKCASTSD